MNNDYEQENMSNTLHRLLAAILLMILIMAGAFVSQVANAQSLPAIGESTVALSYDMAGKRLLKVHANQLFRSGDGGETWQPIALPESAAQGQLVAVAAPNDGSALYIAGPGIGVQRSDNAGESWRPLNDALPGRNVTALTVHRQQPETLYAVLSGDGIYRSEDAGLSWRKMDSGPIRPVRRLLHSDLPGSMQTGWLYAVSTDAVRLSMDCFCGWRPSGELDAGDIYDVTYDPRAPEKVYLAAEQGLFRSDNGGQEWLPVNSDGPRIVALTFAPSDGLLYAATADGEVLRGMDMGKSWE